jgi:hypothetical protein
MGINNTFPIARIKIIEPIVFVNYPNEGIVFLLICDMAV